MRSLTVHPTNPITATISTVPVPTVLAPNEALIKVHVAASNPKDYLHLIARGVSSNSGDDLAGTVVAMGPQVSKLRIGDRVAAFHPMGQPYGAYAEYATAPAHTVFRIPEFVSFAEGSTIPLVSLTAALTLFRRQGFAAPWEPNAEDLNRMPLLVYAATTALGTYAVKLAKLAGVGPVIAIGGGSSGYLKDVLDSHDFFLDYRSGMERVKKDVAQIVSENHLSLNHAIDAFNEDESWVHIAQLLNSGGKVSVFSGALKYEEEAIPKHVQIIYTFVGTGHEGAYRPGMPKQPPVEEAQGDIEFANKFFSWTEDVLQQATYTGHPYEVIPGGLEGVSEGLNRLRSGKAAGKKFVYEIIA